MLLRHGISACLLLTVGTTGCASHAPAPDEAARQEVLRLLMPSRIEIVEPFARLRSFDNSTTPNGIELLIRAVNYLDDPGLMLVGDVRIELFSYVPASADQKGVQIDRWEIPLKTRADQQRYWNQLTQMYEFTLRVNTARLPTDDKFVILVTYRSPLGEFYRDEFVISYSDFSGPSRGAGATGQP
jgi:hypothetical protein